MVDDKKINQENFNYLYSYYLDKGLKNKQIAKKLNISIRSLYYYKKGVITSIESKNIKVLKVKKKKIIIYKKRKVTIEKKKIKPKPKPKPRIKEVQYIFKANCKFDSPPFSSEHFFTWIGKPGLTDDVILKFGRLQHEFWKHHQLENLMIWEKINVYENR